MVRDLQELSTSMQLLLSNATLIVSPSGKLPYTAKDVIRNTAVCDRYNKFALRSVKFDIPLEEILVVQKKEGNVFWITHHNRSCMYNYKLHMTRTSQ
jgi:hypothetical protein